jgi:acetyl esterase/lipase
MRFAVSFTILALSTAAFAAEPRIHRNLSYDEPQDHRHTLDVYTSTESKNAPVVVWIHGGGWQRGDKSDVATKPWAFVERGFVFVSINYRFIPNVTMKQIAQDVTKAIRWSHEHAAQYGGDPATMFVMGHSAGASLTALVCTDDRYLKAEGLSLSILKGCVPVDGDAYDVAMQIGSVEKRRIDSFEMKFGDPASQKDLSAVTHIARGKNIPPFLILHVADPKRAAMQRGREGSPCCPETDVQSQRLVEALTAAGVPAKAYAAEGKNHTTLDAELGLPNDKATAELFEFLDGVLRKKR